MTSATGTFLTIRLYAAATDFCTGERAFRALTFVCKLCNDNLMDKSFVVLDIEQLVVKFDGADFLAGHIHNV